MKTYLTSEGGYQAYLQASYVNENISQENLPLRLLKSLTPEQLKTRSTRN